MRRRISALTISCFVAACWSFSLVACGDDDDSGPATVPLGGTGGAAPTGGTGGVGGAGGTAGAAGAPGPSTPALQFVTAFGGSTLAAQIVDDVAYVGIGRRVGAFDTSDPGAPTELGTSDVLDSTVVGLAVRPPHVFAITSGGLTVLRLEAGGALNVAASLPLSAPYAMALSGSQAFVADQGALNVIDVGDPVRPRLVARHERPEFFSAMAAAGDRVYLGLYPTDGQPEGASIETLNVADPLTPVVVPGATAPGGVVRAMAVSGGRLYVGSDIGLGAYDVTSAGAPVFLGAATNGVSALYVDPASSEVIAASGNDIVTVSFADPSAPFELPLVGRDYDIEGLASGGATLLAFSAQHAPESIDRTFLSAPAPLPNTSASAAQIAAVAGRLVVGGEATIELYDTPSALRPPLSARVAAEAETRFALANGKVVVPGETGLVGYDPASSFDAIPSDFAEGGLFAMVVANADRERAFLFTSDFVGDGVVNAISEWRVSDARVEFVKAVGTTPEAVADGVLVGGHLVVVTGGELVSYAADQPGQPIDREAIDAVGDADGVFAAADKSEIFVAERGGGFWRFRLDPSGQLKLVGGPTAELGSLIGITDSNLLIADQYAKIVLLDPYAATPYEHVAEFDTGGSFAVRAVERDGLVYVALGVDGVAVYQGVPSRP